MGEHVYLVYIDDSKQERPLRTSGFQVIGAVIVNDQHFHMLEQHVGYVLQSITEEYLTGEIEEFHTADLLHGNKPFEKIDREGALRAIESAVSAIISLKIPVVYGAVDLAKLYATNFASANPVDIAFRVCIRIVEEWFQTNDSLGLGLLISDDSDKPSKNVMLNAFHVLRRSVVTSPPMRGELENLHDDMYFGASKRSKGIQLADVCTLLISRHLAGYSDTDELYQSLAANIFNGKIEP
jgi:hypothetical protein